MRLLLIFLMFLSVVLGACSSRPPTNATPDPVALPVSQAARKGGTDDEIRTRARAWVDCLYKRAADYDDNRSDASTIAAAVRAACKDLYFGPTNGDVGMSIEVVLTLRKSGQTARAMVPWRECVVDVLRRRDISAGSVATHAVAAAGVCRTHYRGEPGQDVDIVVNAIEKIRGGNQPAGSIVVGPPQPAPPAEKRY